MCDWIRDIILRLDDRGEINFRIGRGKLRCCSELHREQVVLRKGAGLGVGIEYYLCKNRFSVGGLGAAALVHGFRLELDPSNGGLLCALGIFVGRQR